MPSPNSGLVTRTIPKVTGGVSQRSPVVRDTSQSTELINILPDSTFGMTRRPSSQFNTAIADFNEEHYLYTFQFSATEKYALFVKDGALTVVDLINKTEMDVSMESGADTYLASSNPSKDFQAMTIGNETFVLNRAITVAQDNSTESTADTPSGLVWVRLGDFGTSYYITLDGTQYGYTTNASYRPDVDTNQIAFALTYVIPAGNSLSKISVSSLPAAGSVLRITETVTGKTADVVVPATGYQDPYGIVSANGLLLYIIGAYFYSSPPAAGNLDDLYASIPGITVFFAGDSIWIATPAHGNDNLNFTVSTVSGTGALAVVNDPLRDDLYNIALQGATLAMSKVGDTDFTLATVDGLGDQALEAYKGDAQKFSDLPVSAPDGFKLHITGELSSEVDDFYVQVDTDNSPIGAGVWRESLKGGELTSLDATTMPYLLTPDGSGGWDFAKAEWNPRAVGDLTTNPMPSFVGSTIDDMFFFKNRLGLVSGENRTMSQAAQYFNMFRKTVAQLLDDERIDVASNSGQINKINFATFQDHELILWGDEGQIAVTGTPLLTPKTVSEDPAGAFKTSPDVKPVPSGKFTYFLTDRTGKTQVSEYFSVDASKPRKEVVDLTENIPTYIDGSPSHLAASDANGVIFVGAKSETIA